MSRSGEFECVSSERANGDKKPSWLATNHTERPVLHGGYGHDRSKRICQKLAQNGVCRCGTFKHQGSPRLTLGTTDEREARQGWATGLQSGSAHAIGELDLDNSCSIGGSRLSGQSSWRPWLGLQKAAQGKGASPFFCICTKRHRRGLRATLQVLQAAQQRFGSHVHNCTCIKMPS